MHGLREIVDENVAFAPWLSSAPAADVEVFPQALEFGDVEIGTSADQFLTITNDGNLLLRIEGISLVSGDAGFSVTSSPPSPLVLMPAAMVEVELRFAPSVAGTVADELRITSDDPDENPMSIALRGTGVETELPPSEQIAAILGFFDTAVEEGTLEGAGLGNSAAGRLGALRNMIEASGDLINDGATADACNQLQDVLDRMDGSPRPPDFIVGPAVLELADRIGNLRQDIGCV